MPSLELIVNPGKSSTYRRVIVVVYLLTCAFIMPTSLYITIKVLLFVAIAFHLKNYFHQQKPHPELYEIKYVKEEWITIMNDGQTHHYTDAAVVLHNILFQVLRLSSPTKKKILILFNDQLSAHQLRLLHLKTANIGI